MGHRWFAAIYDPINWLGERRLFAVLRKRLVGTLTGRVLDLGTGANLPYLETADLLVAADPDPYMLRRAVKKAGQARPRIVLVLCTVDSPERSLAELRRVLRPRAALSVLEHVCSADWRGWLEDRVEPAWRRQVAGCHPNRRTGDLLASAGFAFDAFEERDLGTMQLISGVARVKTNAATRELRSEGAPR
jgi:SAM-dependent methyltransferase